VKTAIQVKTEPQEKTAIQVKTEPQEKKEPQVKTEQLLSQYLKLEMKKE
jgi:hypothetical protein